jgi:hypothetical protein
MTTVPPAPAAAGSEADAAHHHHANHVHSLRHRPPASLLRLGLGARLAIAAGITTMVWSMIGAVLR